MNVSNLLKVLRDLGPAQVGLYALYKLGLKTGHYKRVTSKPSTDHCSLITDHWTLPPRDSLAALLGPDGQRSLLLEADEAVSGRFHLFGGDLADIKLGFNQSLHHWADYETNPSLLSSFLFPHNDLKLIWEPARFGWATVLARAYHLTGDDKYAAAFWTHFETFTAANPPYLGPNWISAQEAAIRILAWTFCLPLLRGADSTTEARTRSLADTIAIHAERIPPTLVYARSQNNNHLLSEAAGLITAGTVLPGHTRAQKWLSLGWKWFNKGLEKQIDSYGEYSQHSANYHRLILQLALWVNRLGAPRFTQLARKNLARASHWLASMLDSKSGGVPNLGANDGAYILPLTICPFSDFRPVVGAATRAFLNYDLPSGAWDEMSLWFGNSPTGRTFEADHYLGDNLRGRESWAYLRTTRFTSRPGHADLLHLDLWWRGLNVARDAGTFSYNAEPPWDNPLTVARVHNTVTVDHRDQMTRLSRFLYVDWADAYAKTEIASDENVLRRVTAYHTGYYRLAVEHHRTVSAFADERWQVEDRLVSRYAFVNHVRLHWLLPDWEWDVEGGEREIVVRLQSPEGPIRLVVKCEAGLEMRVARAGELTHGRGEVAPFEGWFSPAYNHKIPALSFAFETRSELPVTFTTEFIFK